MHGRLSIVSPCHRCCRPSPRRSLFRRRSPSLGLYCHRSLLLASASLMDRRTSLIAHHPPPPSLPLALCCIAVHCSSSIRRGCHCHSPRLVPFSSPPLAAAHQLSRRPSSFVSRCHLSFVTRRSLRCLMLLPLCSFAPLLAVCPSSPLLIGRCRSRRSSLSIAIHCPSLVALFVIQHICIPIVHCQLLLLLHVIRHFVGCPSSFVRLRRSSPSIC
mmetsp:Transcript_28454/g.80105  ORF Transcript_28454/g.80105 Transcript_28454/m.80105 type:complete len:215 (-) Transcript_28454:258-902(-)